MKTKSLVLILTLLSSTTLFAQIPSYVPTNGLVGYWPFNGNANDESGNGNNGIVNGAILTSDRNGYVNGAYSFNGVPNRIEIGNIQSSTQLIGSSNSGWSASAWINKNNYTGTLAISDYNSVPGNTNPGENDMTVAINLQVYQNYANAGIRSNGTDYNVSGGVISNNQWHHIAFTANNGVLILYVDGVNVAQSNYNSALNFYESPIYRIGTSMWNGNYGPSTGSIDDVALWNRALTQQEITALYQSNSCSVPAYVPTNGLVGYWPFCGNANDVSGNGNNGTVNGATLSTDRFGIANQCYNFNDDEIEIPYSAQLGFNPSNSFSIGLWALKDGNQPLMHLVGKRSLFSPFFNWQIAYQSNVYFQSGTGPGLTTGTNSQSVLVNQTWTHIVGVYSNGSWSIYIDGVLSNSNLGFANLDDISNLVFGNSGGFEPFYGKLDDIGIWNRALSALEIQQLYNSTPCTKPEPVTLGTSATTVRCPNDQVSIFVVTPSTAGLSYEWTRNGTTMPGATASSITVSDAAKYKVFVRSGPGLDCQRVSGLIETTAAIPPTITATTPNGNAYCPGDSVLMSATGITPGYSYQWKRFGVPIAGATSATFYAKQTGNYRCEVSNAGGCINQSNLVNIVNGTSCRIMQDQSSDVNVYPNPAKNSFTVSFNDIGNETPVSIELRNLQGQSIENRKLNGLSDVQFNVGKLSPGMYMVRVMLESGDVVEKNVMVE